MKSLNSLIMNLSFVTTSLIPLIMPSFLWSFNVSVMSNARNPVMDTTMNDENPNFIRSNAPIIGPITYDRLQSVSKSPNASYAVLLSECSLT